MTAVDWTVELQTRVQEYREGGLTPDDADRAARAEIQLRQAVAGRDLVLVDVQPGELLESPDGEPLGMSENQVTRIPLQADDHGRFAAVWSDPTDPPVRWTNPEDDEL